MSLKTLSKSIDLLDCFTAEQPTWGVRELAKHLNMNTTVVHRIVSTFEQHGILMQNKETMKYHLGLRLLEYSKVVTEQLNIQQYVRPLLKEIMDATGESVYLTMLEGKVGVVVAVMLSTQEVKHIIPVGTRGPLYAGASHKVMMAFLDEEVQQEIMEEGLRSVTPETIVEPDVLREQLEQIRKHGWCISVGEFTEDVIGIAIPIQDSQGRVMGSVTVAGPKYRFSEEMVERSLNVLLFQLPFLRQSFNIISHIW
ncbi:IclR family transcriptional regulator [Paenibacillus selenitireducens]|uniref:IclR family transcriptional regulator n=1 Tax=Paenibacillus selenitireducens TaxID=1324314 RepID=A0A1T2X4E7_9BACL|nr:IclR family transcriptional regulator [Paenibacillus selenitireducens]OPA74727.1 IclR family transcriptional regulator [Paenibacillus selenitireducens]